MRKTLLKWLLLISLFAYVTAVTIWAHGEAARHECTGIEISIANSYSPDSITVGGVREELNKYPKKITGIPAVNVNTLEIEDYLSKFSNFEKVECAMTTKGILKVSIIPMIPEIRVFDKNGSYYINKDGKKIASKANFFIDVPVVAGNFNNRLSPTMVLPVTRFISNDPLLNQLVGMVEVKDPDNIILIPRIQGHVINFGDTTRLGEKRSALIAFYKKVIPYKGWNEYDTISVKFNGQIVASRHNKNRNQHTDLYEEEIDLEEATLPLELSPSNNHTENAVKP